MATFTGYFRYKRISPPSKQDTLWLCPWTIRCHPDDPSGLIPAPRASIIVPGSSVHLNANTSAICVFIDGFRLLWIHRWTLTGHEYKYPCIHELEIPHTSKYWRTLFIELIAGMIQIFKSQIWSFHQAEASDLFELVSPADKGYYIGWLRICHSTSGLK